MRDKQLRRVLFVRRAYQMTVISVILVMVISIVIVAVTGSPTGERADCGPVQNLAVEENDGKVVLSWERPTGACGPLYYIWYTINDGDLITSIILDTRFEIGKVFCSRYEVTISSAGISGEPSSATDITHVTKMAGSATAENLQVTDGLIQWDRPEDSENCDLTYEITIVHDTGTITEHVTETSLPLPTIVQTPCSSSVITATATVVGQTTPGNPTSINFRAPVTRLAPQLVYTDPAFFFATARWMLKDEINVCPVYKIRFTGSSEDGSSIIDAEFDVDVTNVNTVEVVLTGLIMETKYSYSAEWILEEPYVGKRSSEVTFFTRPVPDLVIENVTVNELTVTVNWNMDYVAEFITTNEITVESISSRQVPIPVHCEANGEMDDNQDITAEGADRSKDFDVTNYFFNYEVTVTAVFGTMGLRRSQTYQFSTVEGPTVDIGTFNIQPIYTPGEQYAVTMHIEWEMPCKINSALTSFEYEISGTLQSPVSSGTCQNIIFLSNSIDFEVVNSKYQIDTDVLIPFFDYSLTVRNGNALKLETNIELPVPHNPSVLLS